jgi:hypothetical protein
MAIAGNRKRRLVEWLLRHAFDEEEKAWPSIEPEVARLVDDIANSRFQKSIRHIETEIDDVDESESADQQARVMGRPLAFIVRNIILGRAEADGEPFGVKQRRRLGHLVADHFDTPGPLFAIVRVGARHPRSGDQHIIEQFLRLQTEEESNIMPGPTDPSNFAFDTSSLPDKFGEDKFRDFYRDAVKRGLEKLGNAGPTYVAATVGLLLIEGQYDPESPAFFKYVQRIFTELSGSADPDHQIDFGDSKLYYPNGPKGAQRIDIYAAAFDSLTNPPQRGDEDLLSGFRPARPQSIRRLQASAAGLGRLRQHGADALSLRCDRRCHRRRRRRRNRAGRVAAAQRSGRTQR